MDKSSGWMQAVVFNSLLILMPVIAAQSLAMAFSGESFSESPTIESIDQTRRNIDETFASIAPRNGGDKYKFWHDIVERELMDMDVAAARGFLLAAPQMLDRESVRELEADSSGVKLDRPDDRMAAAALRKLPLDIGLKFEKAQASAGPRNTPSSTSIVEEEEASDDPADTQDADVPNEEPEVTVSGNTRPSDRRFVLLGSF
ncbi:MAG TPA: hypothetical protein DCX29_05850, partial [Hyphomonas sp.]|nr:hypothetical protein [Hyphomonas sp.]